MLHNYTQGGVTHRIYFLLNSVVITLQSDGDHLTILEEKQKSIIGWSLKMMGML